MTIKRLFAAALLTLVTLMPGGVHAITTVDENSLINDSIYYVENDADCNALASGTGLGTLAGADNRQKIWNWLRSKSLSAEQAAGVIGNMFAESGFNPARNQGSVLGAHAWGLAQWDGGRRDALLRLVRADTTLAPLYDMKFAGPTDVSTGYIPDGMTVAQNDALMLLELNFLYQESNNRPVTATGFGSGDDEWSVLLQQKTVQDATVFWHNNFEVSNDTPAEVIHNRGGAAQEAFDAYNSGIGVGGSTGGLNCEDSVAAPTGNFPEILLSYAWPDYRGSGYTTKTPGYNAAVKAAQQKGVYVGGFNGVDCGGFVTLFMINSGFEPTYNYSGMAGAGGTPTQLAWARANWQSLGPASSINPADLEPGDVAIKNGHTFVWVGDIPGFGAKIASASLGDRSPMADTAQSPTEAPFEWFRKK
ncbi:MAG TPA: phage tail tip lysozyme [Candidatus Saccharimonadia bacterium]|nr:phage tail tip lysozyme [Candidatus Saccharimonadia bacterium]